MCAVRKSGSKKASNNVIESAPRFPSVVEVHTTNGVVGTADQAVRPPSAVTAREREKERAAPRRSPCHGFNNLPEPKSKN